jgi:hypothetical protein
MAHISISELSQTISELIDLDADQQSVLGSAIDRALDARKVVGGTTSGKLDFPPGTVGLIATTEPSHQPLINGLMPSPDYFPIGKIANPHPTPITPDPVLTPIHPRPRPRPRHPRHYL